MCVCPRHIWWMRQHRIITAGCIKMIRKNMMYKKKNCQTFLFNVHKWDVILKLELQNNSWPVCVGVWVCEPSKKKKSWNKMKTKLGYHFAMYLNVCLICRGSWSFSLLNSSEDLSSQLLHFDVILVCEQKIFFLSWCKVHIQNVWNQVPQPKMNLSVTYTK